MESKGFPMKNSKQNWLRISRNNASSQRMPLVNIWDINDSSEYAKSINSRGDVGHKCIKMSSDEDGNKKSVSYFNSIDKVIDDNVSDSSNVCNDNLNMSFKGLSGRQREKDWRHRLCIIYFNLHPQLIMNCR